MRSLGSLQETALAKQFGEILELQGIAHRIDPDERGEPEIWIVDEEEVMPARELLARFLAEPAADVHKVDPEALAAHRRRLAQDDRARNAFKSVDVRTHVFSQRAAALQVGPATASLIGMSTLAFLASFSEGRGLLDALAFSFPGDRAFAALRELQIWRLFTPIFLHFGFLHFLFNMMWLKDLGALVETRDGTRGFLVLVAFLAVLPNTAQYLASGPAFGGMSGVVYGLLGYVWMRERYEPASHFTMQPYAAFMMLAWYFACVFGLVGRIANVAHGAGLVLGMAWGLWRVGPAQVRAAFSRRRKADLWILAVFFLALPLAWWADHR